MHNSENSLKNPEKNNEIWKNTQNWEKYPGKLGKVPQKTRENDSETTKKVPTSVWLKNVEEYLTFGKILHILILPLTTF